MNRIMLFPGFKQKALTLSYDDGVEQDIRLIGIMQKHGLKGTFNINTGLFAPEGTVFPAGQIHRRMSAKQAYDLYTSTGMEVAVHALTHPHLELLTPAEVTYEVMTDRANIEQATGKICRGMAYPYGTFNAAVLDVLRDCGILYSRAVAPRRDFTIPEDWLKLTPTTHHNDPGLMDLAKKFVEETPPSYGPPWMFYLWGHAYEFDIKDNWNVIEDFAAYIGNREDIWYATNSEIFEYIEAYHCLRTSADSKRLYNPTDRPLYFRINGKDYAIEAGKELAL